VWLRRFTAKQKAAPDCSGTAVRVLKNILRAQLTR
jgi:hypothetical protein